MKYRIYRNGKRVADCYTPDEAAILLSVLAGDSYVMVGRLTIMEGSETESDGESLSYDQISAELTDRLNDARRHGYNV